MVSLMSERERRVCGVFNEISRDLSMKRDVQESSLKTPQTLRSPSLPSSHLVKRSLPDISFIFFMHQYVFSPHLLTSFGRI